jgi:hypothetical protein
MASFAWVVDILTQLYKAKIGRVFRSTKPKGCSGRRLMLVGIAVRPPKPVNNFQFTSNPFCLTDYGKIGKRTPPRIGSLVPRFFCAT